jgi:hypothetical protein
MSLVKFNVYGNIRQLSEHKIPAGFLRFGFRFQSPFSFLISPFHCCLFSIIRGLYTSSNYEDLLQMPRFHRLTVIIATHQGSGASLVFPTECQWNSGGVTKLYTYYIQTRSMCRLSFSSRLAGEYKNAGSDRIFSQTSVIVKLSTHLWVRLSPTREPKLIE